MLESIARLIPSLPEPAIEQQLLTFDALLGVSDLPTRPAAAQLLRDASAASPDPACRERLLRAADAVAAGEPCAFTPDGLSAKQAAAAQTVTQQEWEERVANSPLPPLPELDTDEHDDDEDDADDEEDYMQAEPPKLPHLPVRHFFSGLVIRAARDFTDSQGRAICSGDRLKLLSCEPTDDGYVLSPIVRWIRLSAADPVHAAIIENADNAWLQPVPSIHCLEELREAIDRELSVADEDEEMDDDDIERIETLRDDVEACEAWLSQSGERLPAPRCRSGSLAARVFGRDHHLAGWIRLLYAGVTVALPDADAGQ